MQDTVSSATVAAGLVANPGPLGALTDGNHFGWAKDARDNRGNRGALMTST
jgi:hypothetical protein